MPWVTDLLADQQFGGGVAWAIGELPALLLALIVAMQWSRTDRAESVRQDRRADRDGDAELRHTTSGWPPCARRERSRPTLTAGLVATTR